MAGRVLPEGIAIMQRNRRAAVLGMALACLFIASLHTAIRKSAAPTSRDDLIKAHKDGNYKDAYEGLRKLALDPSKSEPKKVGEDLNLGIDCLRRLGRVDEIDEFRESTVAVHKDNWRLLHTAAMSFNNVDRYGFIVA